MMSKALLFPLQVPFRRHLSLYGWGLADHGGLGIVQTGLHRSRSFKYIPRPLLHFFSETHKLTDVECGYGFSLLLTEGKLFGCGINSDSQIGYHDPRRGNPLEALLSPAPISLGAEDSIKVLSMGAGRAHSVVVTDKGVFTFGSNCYGQCGREIIPDERYFGSQTVHRLEIAAKILSVTCGQDHTLLLSENGQVFSCGWGSEGQTGLGEGATMPRRVKGDIENEIIVKVACRSDCVLALSAKGEVFGWGSSEYGQLDKGSESVSTNQTFAHPVFLSKLEGIGKVVDIAAGGTFCVALNDEGEVFVWGCGILGSKAALVHDRMPMKIPPAFFGTNEFSPDVQVVKVVCGISHLAAINSVSDLYMWGKNRHGCLGIGHSKDQYFPFKVSIGGPVKKISCGVDHTMVLCGNF